MLANAPVVVIKHAFKLYDPPSKIMLVLVIKHATKMKKPGSKMIPVLVKKHASRIKGTFRMVPAKEIMLAVETLKIELLESVLLVVVITTPAAAIVLNPDATALKHSSLSR